MGREGPLDQGYFMAVAVVPVTSIWFICLQCRQRSRMMTLPASMRFTYSPSTLPHWHTISVTPLTAC